ncbi:MAG TPA: MarR family transcriptional regulator [Limnochordia bacterium]|nr:MarR family transcriptional regulator [Limnochordia bacterium]
MPQGDLVLEFMETLESLKTCGRAFFRCSGPVRGSAMRLLLLLHHHVGPDDPGLQPSELGELLQLTRPTITTLVNTLEEQGLVERAGTDGDRRVVHVRPTARGAALVQEARAELTRRISGFMDYLGEGDSQELLRLLRRMRTFLQEQETRQEGKREPCGS